MEITPIHQLAGGVLIGLSAALMLLATGRIAGVGGFTARALGLGQSAAPRSFALLFIFGLVAGGALVAMIAGPIEASYAPTLAPIIAGGLAMGIGTRLASGCLSGHGVCGVARLSRRSLTATGLFMVAGIATVAIVNALGGGWR